MGNDTQNVRVKNNPIPESVYETLPPFLKEIVEGFTGRERDVVLVSTVVAISSCLPNVQGQYDRDFVYANLFAVITAPAASGKGVMNKARILITPIHRRYLELTRQAQKEWKEKEKEGAEIGPFPERKIKFLPANTSTAEMYSLIACSPEGVLIMESEADTLGNMLSNDWSNFSDVLRKAFHHEALSISRKMDRLFLEIEEPKLSILISGTPDQLINLVKSKENGLFSRFIVYTFDDITDFKDVFDEGAFDVNAAFNKAAEEFFSLHDRLLKIQEKIIFRLSQEQRFKFRTMFQDRQQLIIASHPHGFLASLKRYGVICFRIAMILSVLRNIRTVNVSTNLLCSDEDFEIATILTKIFLDHSLIVYNNYDEGILSEIEEEILFGLNEKFSRKEAVALAKSKGVPQRTMDEKLKKWVKMKLIFHVAHGEYRRNPANISH